MAFISCKEVTEAINNGYGQTSVFMKTSLPTNAQQWFTLWRQAGNPPDAGAVPSTGTVCDSSTLGAMQIQDAGSGKKLHAYSIGAAALNWGGVVILYDRLWHAGTLPFQTSSTLITGVTAPNRYTSGIGNCLFLETASGQGSGTYPITVSISYTNEIGTPGRIATFEITSAFAANRVIFGLLQSPDRGVQSIQSYSCSSVPNSGTFNIVMYNQSMFNYIGYPAAYYLERDLIYQVAHLPIVQNGACLSGLFWSAEASPSFVWGTIKMVQG
ncbi:MAG TPA: hypothetical protein PKA10_19760 [Selenomonadales bacterium]|nr:hypothetical protein [Selenomonadales bacterium]